MAQKCGTNYVREWKRRKILGAMGAGATLGLAGCLGDGEVDDDIDDVDDPGEVDDAADGMLDATFRINTELSPIPELHVNPYNPTDYFGDLAQLLFDDAAFYHWPTGDYIPHLVTEWDLGVNPMILTVSDEFTWHTGDAFTAEDLAIDLQLELFIGGALADFVDEVTVVDEQTVELNRTEDVSPDIAAFGILPRQVGTPRMEYGDFIERIEDATSEDEEDDIAADLIRKTIMPDEAYGYGPFEITHVGDISVETELFEDNPYAELFNFRDYHIIQGEEETAFQEAVAGELDGIQGGMTLEMVNQFEEMGWTIMDYPWGRGFGLAINYEELPEFRNRKVRWALNYAIDNELATADSIQYRPVHRPTGLVGTWDGSVWEFLDIEPETFISYERDLDRATELLEEEGFSRDDGTWYTPDDEVWDLGSIYHVSIFAPVVSMFRSVVAQLNEFGIEAEMGGAEPADVGRRRAEGDFNVMQADWGGGVLHPWYNMEFNLTNGRLEGGFDIFNTVNYNDYWEVGDDAYVVELPPIGEPDADPSETLDLLETLDALFTMDDMEEARELYRKYAWWHNWEYAFPILHEFDGPNNFFAPEWEIPSEDHEVWGYRTGHGDLTAKGLIRATPDAV